MKLTLPKKHLQSIFTFGLFLIFSVSNAQIAQWTYEPQQGTLNNPTPNTGSGTSAIINLGGGTITPMIRTGMTGSGCGNQNGVNAWAFEPFDPGTLNERNGAQFTTATTGYQNIIFTWDQRWSNTAPNTLRFQYTTNGTVWNNFTMTGANTTFCNGSINASGCFETNSSGDQYRRISVNLSAITGANNNPNFGVRILAAHYQATGQFRQCAAPGSVAGIAGTWRFDNVTISGTPLPGPTASVLSAIAPTAFCPGGSTNLRVAITGGASPYTVTYFNGAANVVVSGYVSGTNIPVTPAATTTYTLVSVVDANGVTGTGNTGTPTVTVYALPAVPTSSNVTTCATGAVALPAGSPTGGTYSIANPYSGPSTTFTYTVTNANGCQRTSTTYTFTRNTLPSIITQPSTSAQTECGGSNFAPISVVASANTTSYQWYWDTDTVLGGQTLIGGATAATYTPANNFTGTRYFVVRIFSSCGNIYSAYSGAFTSKSTTWTGTWSNGIPDSSTTAIFAADYNSAGNLNACTVQVNSGNIVFNPNHTLTIQNGLAVVGGTVTFENDASLVQVNNTANSGTITYKRNTTPVRRFDYTYWSSPVDAQILANLSPLTMADKYYWWNTAIYNWNSVAAPGITPMDIGKGYIIRAPQTFDIAIPAIFNGAFSGIPNNGDYTVPIAISGANDLNLIGNPYPSAIDADLFLSNVGPNANIVGGTIYFWTHNTPIDPLQYTQSDYAMYNAVGGVGTAGGGLGNTNVPNGFVAAGQAFFVKGINVGGTATFSNSMRVANNNDQFFRVANVPTEKHRIWLEMRNNAGAYKQMLVGYLAGATNDKDRNFDGDMIDGGTVAVLYSLLGENRLGIQGRALPFNSNDVVPIGYKTTIAGNFEIALSDFDGLFGEQDIFLEDQLLGIIHDLKATPYAFTTAVGTFDDRFRLRFTAPSLGTNHPDSNENDLVVYKANGAIAIHSSNIEIESVKVFDMTGRRVFEKANINSEDIILTARLGTDIYIVQVKTSDGKTTNRKTAN